MRGESEGAERGTKGNTVRWQPRKRHSYCGINLWCLAILFSLPCWMWQRQGFGKICRSSLHTRCCICKWRERGGELEVGRSKCSTQYHRPPLSGITCRSRQRSCASSPSWILFFVWYRCTETKFTWLCGRDKFPQWTANHKGGGTVLWVLQGWRLCPRPVLLWA